MKLITLSLLSFCAMATALAQTSAPVGFDANANLANMNSSMFRSFDNRYTGMQGHSTVFPDFVYGNVNMKSGERAEGQELNYDAIANELIVRSRVYKKVLAVRPDLVESFELITAEGDTLFFKKVTERGFCQVVHEGESRLYLKYVKQLVKAQIGGAYNTNGKTYDELIDANVYLISVGGSELQEIKLSRKGFEARFPEHKEAIRTFIRENKTDFKNQDDIVRLVKFIDGRS